MREISAGFRGVLLALFTGLLLANGASAAERHACPQHFAAGTPPALVNPRLAERAAALCFRAFAVLHSGATRTPLYAAERLTSRSVALARATPRRNSFHAEPLLARADRAELADYDHSGFDRGHLAPSADMPDAEADRESFSLANVAPQASGLNRGAWAGIEASVQAAAVRRGVLYVVTGPAFAAAELASVGNVLVPTHFWKAIHDPARRQAGAYLVENADGAAWRQVSLVQLAALTGIQPFLGVFARTMRLPRPRTNR